MVYVTRGLLSVLLETAADSEPESVTVGLSATPAGDLSGVDASGAADAATDVDDAPAAGGSAAAGADDASGGGDAPVAADASRDADAADLVGLPADAPVFTHMYLPEAGGSVSAVFGMDLSTPAGGIDGRFISHPTGGLGVSTTDDLHGVMLVAVPPWEPESVAAFDRRGRRGTLEVVDAVPPEETLS